MNNLGINTGTGTTTGFQLFTTHVEHIQTIENPDSIEFIYKETHTPNTWPNSGPRTDVFKHVFSCKDGKWHKSERIYGKIVPAQNEYYDFEETENI